MEQTWPLVHNGSSSVSFISIGHRQILPRFLNSEFLTGRMELSLMCKNWLWV